MIKKSLLIWVSIIPLAILNGGLRDKVVNPLIGKTYGQPLSGILLCLLIFFLCYFSIPLIGKGPAKIYWKIGLLWVILTILFEFGFGLLTGTSFPELIKAYNISTGNLWLLVVVFIGIVPWSTAKIKKII